MIIRLFPWTTCCGLERDFVLHGALFCWALGKKHAREQGRAKEADRLFGRRQSLKFVKRCCMSSKRVSGGIW